MNPVSAVRWEEGGEYIEGGFLEGGRGGGAVTDAVEDGGGHLQ